MTTTQETLSPLAERVLGVLRFYTAFSWPVLRAQCDRLSLSPATLNAAQLPPLIPLLAAGVARFTSPLKGEQVRRELELLLRNP